MKKRTKEREREREKRERESSKRLLKFNDAGQRER